MVKKLYHCENCSKIFFYSEKEGGSGFCRNCMTNGLQLIEEYTVFVCPECNRHYDGESLINPQKKSKGNRPAMSLGMLVCGKDGIPIEVQSFKEDLARLTEKVMQQFSAEQVEEMAEEGEFIDKLNRLREDITSTSVATSTDEILHDSLKPSDTPTSASTPTSTVASKTASQPPTAISDPTIILTDYSQILSPEPLDIPHADEFWEFYYEEQNLDDNDAFLGSRTVQKIRGLLEEVSLHILNQDKFDLRYPIIEEMAPDRLGKVFYVGDTHGSIHDTDKCIRFFVKEIEQAEKEGKEIRIIFDGDYVDRNPADIHNMLYIFTFALKYPRIVRLLRGNHEEVTINMQYGFWENINVYLPNSYLFNDFEYTFMNLPLVHIMIHPTQKKKIVCLHGGLPFYDKEFEEMPEIPNLLKRLDPLDSHYSNIDEMDPLSQQILWGDPAPVDRLPINVFFLPSPRGLGFVFGEKVFNQWMKVNETDLCIRAHEYYAEGHRFLFGNRLISLFSSSTYVGRTVRAKILEVDFAKPWESNWTLLTIQEDL